MDGAGPQPLYVVVSYIYQAQYFSSIFLLEKNANNRVYKPCLKSEGRPKIKRSSSLPSLDLDTHPKQNLTSEGLPKIKTCFLDLQKDYVAHLTQPPPRCPPLFTWTICKLAISAEELCMVPEPGSILDPIDVQLKGCILNLRTKDCKSIELPEDCRFYKHVVSLGGRIYFLTYSYFTIGSFFTCYDPLNDSWVTLEPFPDSGYGISEGILATAVLDDTIVINAGEMFWAYNVGRNQWYPVTVDDRECYSILGEAVVLENTIYALTKMSHGLVLAFSFIKKNKINDDLEFSCSTPSKIIVPGMEENKIVNKDSGWLTRHLVHLGEDNFCLVECCNSELYPVDCQPIQVTYLKLEKGDGENSTMTMTVTDTFIYKLKILLNEQFHVELCFSLPNHMTDALKAGKGSVLKFNPFPEDYAAEQKDKNQSLNLCKKFGEKCECSTRFRRNWRNLGLLRGTESKF